MIEWFTQQQAGYIGGIGGAALGVIGGCYGAALGILAPRGECKRLVLGIHIVLMCVGIALIGAGLVAVIVSQPYHVTYPFFLGGLILIGVFGFTFPMMRARYRQAEQRKLQAEELRRS
jgi:hypothetical protein